VKKNRLVLSDAAIADIIEQAEWYSTQSGNDLAGRWERAVTSAIMRVVDRPTTGPLCTFQSQELRNVRRTPIPGFPKHLLFYRFDPGEVFVLRVVHGARDLERLL
jgi:toxin ParE1/3/4